MLEWLTQSLTAGDAAGIAAGATVLAACIALIGVLLSAIISLLISGRNLFVNTVTIERSKWIEKLRQNIASCSGLLRTLSYKAAAGNFTAAEREEYIQKVNRLISLIPLQLNPFGEIDQTILSLLESMPALAEQQDGARLRTADDKLIKHSQWLLKAEWEKVKYEPRWWLSRWYGRAKARCHLTRYRRFRDGDEGNPRVNDGEGPAAASIVRRDRPSSIVRPETESAKKNLRRRSAAAAPPRRRERVALLTDLAGSARPARAGIGRERTRTCVSATTSCHQAYPRYIGFEMSNSTNKSGVLSGLHHRYARI
jgi:hypothetical protein